MENNELTLLKRYKYDKREKYDVDEERRTSTTTVRVSALDVYDYNGTPYIVSVSWYNAEYDERRDYYYRSLTLTVYPIDTADVGNEARVRAIEANEKGFEWRASVGPYLPTSYSDDRDRNGDYDSLYFDTRNEENFTSSLCSRVISAIMAYLKRKE